LQALSRPSTRRTCRRSSGACTLAWQPAAGAATQFSARRRSTHCPAQAHEPTTALERGAVLRGAVAAVVAAVAPTTVTVARAADVDYKAVAADIAKIIKIDPDKGPTFLRLAWHSSGSVHIYKCRSQLTG